MKMVLDSRCRSSQCPSNCGKECKTLVVVLAEDWKLVSSSVRFSLQNGCRYRHKHPGRTNAFAISLLSLLLEEIINFGGAHGR